MLESYLENDGTCSLDCLDSVITCQIIKHQSQKHCQNEESSQSVEVINTQRSNNQRVAIWSDVVDYIFKRKGGQLSEYFFQDIESDEENQVCSSS